MAGKELCNLEFEKKKDLITNKREIIEEVEWIEKEEAWLYLWTGRARETLEERGSSLSPRVSPSRAAPRSFLRPLPPSACYADVRDGQLNTNPRLSIYLSLIDTIYHW